MKVSTKGRYAIRVMLDLAVNNTGEYIKGCFRKTGNHIKISGTDHYPAEAVRIFEKFPWKRRWL